MDTSKIIKGVVSNGRYTVTAPIVKEDYGLYLQIEGVELPSTYQVDFSNDEYSGSSVTMIGNADGVLIPAQFIKSGKAVFAFLYHVGEDFGRTVYKFRIPNKVRPDRTNEEPTPEEQSTIDQAISALNDAVAQTAQDKADADASAQASAESAQASGVSALSASNSALSSAEYASNALGHAESASQSAQASANSASASAQSAQSAEQSAQTASAKADAITGLTATAQTLPEGSSASASYNPQTGVMSFGIPKGKDGTNGDDGYSPTASVSKSGKVATVTITDKNGTTSAQVSDGATGATPNLTIGTVETLEPTESATASITGTPENPVLNLGIPQGDAGEVTLADLNTALADKADVITDTASGSIASFTDGADNLPLKSLIVDINPVQDLSQGDPSPTNICPISGWTSINVNHSDADTTNPTTITIPLGQTVYGAKLYPLEGKALITMAMVDMGSLNWFYDASTSIFSSLPTGISRAISPPYDNRQKGAICSMFPPSTTISLNANMTDNSWLRNNYDFCVRSTNYTNASDFKSAVTGQQLVYELAEPIEIQLSANQVNSLLGVNNIWADSGDTEVEYRADTKLYIERLTAPDSADMIADANITSGQYFMVGNTLYKATANIANGSAIVVGTNCIRKSLSEALNEINA